MDQFIALGQNKADSAEFLSNVIIQRASALSDDYVVVSVGGFSDPENAKSNQHA